jgi:mercuric ion binding protein
MKLKYFLMMLMIVCSSALFAQAKTDTVKVWGSCEECKDKIEKAAKKAGAASADWNDETYLLVVNYSSDKTSSLAIQKSIAAVGYDTQDVKADDVAYKKLPKCCRYKREEQPAMKQE